MARITLVFDPVGLREKPALCLCTSEFLSCDVRQPFPAMVRWLNDCDVICVNQSDLRANCDGAMAQSCDALRWSLRS